MVLNEEKEPEEIQEILHSSGDGSNALIFYKSEKDKGLKRKKEAPALRKIKQKKLRKLEDEKKQKLLQAKSIELLGKYKISDGAYSLLHSSGNIGQVETIKEKCSRAVQYSKAGLEVPEEISIFKKEINMDYYSENLVDRQFDMLIENMIEGPVRVSSMIEDGSSVPGLKACNTAVVHDFKFPKRTRH